MINRTYYNISITTFFKYQLFPHKKNIRSDFMAENMLLNIKYNGNKTFHNEVTRNPKLSNHHPVLYILDIVF